MSIMVLPRRFKYNQLQLDDPDANMSPESVKEFYGGIYPELTQAVVEGPEVRDNGVEYSFRRAVGTKGRGRGKKNKEDGKEKASVADMISIMEALSNIIDRQSLESAPVFPPSSELGPV